MDEGTQVVTIPGKLCSPITFANLEVFCKDASLPAVATNDQGESVIVAREYGGDEYCYRLDIAQHNDWMRIERYYPDGSLEWSYEKGEER